MLGEDFACTAFSLVKCRCFEYISTVAQEMVESIHIYNTYIDCVWAVDVVTLYTY
jgi:dimeric dUTPase (all-alpha-NTP-PPase superfamily)